MALSGKTVSLKNIISKVFRDLKLKEEDDFVDFIEWGAEALEHIGVFEQLTTEVKEIYVHNYKAELPFDLVYLNAVDYNGRSLTTSPSFFGIRKGSTPVSHADTGLSINEDKIKGATYNGIWGSYDGVDNGYKVENGFIKVGFKEGCLNISYQALPIDCEGYPLVPDEIAYREALYRYIVYKYLYPKYIQGTVSQNVITDAENKWNWYCGQAGAKAKMPSLGQLENIKRNYLSLKPRVDQFKEFFDNLNKNITH